MKATSAVVGVAAAGAVLIAAVVMGQGNSTPSGSSNTSTTTGCPGQTLNTAAAPAWATIPSQPTVPPVVNALRRDGVFTAATPAAAAPATVPPAVPVPSTPAAAAQTAGGGAVPTQPAATACDSSYNAGARAAGATATWDPGNIISDAVFYNTASMTVDQVRTFINTQNASCSTSNQWCLKNLKVSFTAQPADQYCQAVPAGNGIDTATAVSEFSAACGINPQVMLTTLQKESQGLTRTNPTASTYDAAWGWNCPDTGTGGSANCDPAGRGFFLQGYMMAKQWSKYRQRIPAGYYPYQVGKTVDILWNVAETGCGSSPVTIKNIATASLYVYTPYQPNPASLAAYPGEGDRCSSYGNRNFFRMFQKYFGDTGGGLVPASSGNGNGQPAAYQPGPTQTASGQVGPIPVAYNGNRITIPSVDHVPTNMQGQTITAPNAKVAAALAAGLTWLGTPYSWGGGSATGPTLGICGPDGAENDCNINGFDCSGLTMYIAAKFGVTIPHLSTDQRDSAHAIPWSSAQPGDIVGYSGHVTIFIGTFNGVRMQLEAPNSHHFIQITNVGNAEVEDNSVYRYWQ